MLLLYAAAWSQAVLSIAASRYVTQSVGIPKMMCSSQYYDTHYYTLYLVYIMYLVCQSRQSSQGLLWSPNWGPYLGT